MPLILDQGMCRIFQVCDGAYIGFCKTDEALQNDQLVFTLEIADVDSYCDQLEAKGVIVEILPRFNSDYNIYQMFIRDPNGYLIEIQRFEDPLWPSS
jgi:catechol 2,3-dioxygenase-like lactoylglutathione lyase family enzyme